MASEIIKNRTGFPWGRFLMEQVGLKAKPKEANARLWVPFYIWEVAKGGGLVSLQSPERVLQNLGHHMKIDAHNHLGGWSNEKSYPSGNLSHFFGDPFLAAR